MSLNNNAEAGSVELHENQAQRRPAKPLRRDSGIKMAQEALILLDADDWPGVQALVEAGADVNHKARGSASLGLLAMLAPNAPQDLTAKIIPRLDLDPGKGVSGAAGETLLMAALNVGNVELAKRLLVLGHDRAAKLVNASPRLRSARGASMLMVAVSLPEERLDLVELFADPAALLHRDVAKNSALALACSMGRVASIKALLPGSDIRARDEQQRTLLMRAVESKSVEAARLILPKAKARARNQNGESALMIAAKQGRLDMVEELLPKSAPAAFDERGHTALAKAIMAGCEEVALRLLPLSPLTLLGGQAKAAKTNLLMLAAQSRSRGARIVEALLPSFDPLDRDLFGETALMKAAARPNDGGLAAAKLLVGASDEEAVADCGKDAAAFADRSRSVECAKLIRASALSKKEARELGAAVAACSPSGRRRAGL